MCRRSRHNDGSFSGSIYAKARRGNFVIYDDNIINFDEYRCVFKNSKGNCVNEKCKFYGEYCKCKHSCMKWTNRAIS